MNPNAFKSLTRRLFVTFCGFIALNSSFAFAQKRGGGSTGGGDTCEREVQTIRDDIKTWIEKGGPQIRGLIVPENDYQSYSSRMLGALYAPITIECVKATANNPNPIKVHGVSKTCNYDRLSKILRCDLDKFRSDSEDDRYVMIHHEYAGYAGLEEPDGPSSNYHLSNQISKGLERVMVKRLSVQPIVAQAPMTKMLSETDFVIQYQGLLIQKITELVNKRIRTKPEPTPGKIDFLEFVDLNSMSVTIVDSVFGEYRYRWTGSTKDTVVKGPHFGMSITLKFLSKNGTTPLYCNFTLWSSATAKFDNLGNWTGEYIVETKDLQRPTVCILQNLNTNEFVVENEQNRQWVTRYISSKHNVFAVRP